MLPKSSLHNLETVLSNPIIVSLIKGQKIAFIKAVRSHFSADPGLRSTKYMADRLWELADINDRVSDYGVKLMQDALASAEKLAEDRLNSIIAMQEDVDRAASHIDEMRSERDAAAGAACAAIESEEAAWRGINRKSKEHAEDLDAMRDERDEAEREADNLRDDVRNLNQALQDADIKIALLKSLITGSQ
jgi:chromosome segregation ATPase